MVRLTLAITLTRCAAPPHWRVAPGAKGGAIVEPQEVEVEVTLRTIQP